MPTGKEAEGKKVSWNKNDYVSQGDGTYTAPARPGKTFVWVDHPQLGKCMYLKESAEAEGLLGEPKQEPTQTQAIEKAKPQPKPAPSPPPSKPTRRGSTKPPKTEGMLAEKYWKEATTVTDENFHDTGRGNKAPDAHAYQIWGNAEQISHAILDVGKDDQKAWAKVAGWKGDRDDPDLYTEEYVSQYHFEIVQRALVKLQKRENKRAHREGRQKRQLIKFTNTDDGKRVLVLHPKVASSNEGLMFYDRMMDKRMFSDRTVITKAKKRVIRSLLGHEYRDQGEIEEEKEEMEAVKKLKEAGQ